MINSPEIVKLLAVLHDVIVGQDIIVTVNITEGT
jgi:hypothetical protein